MGVDERTYRGCTTFGCEYGDEATDFAHDIPACPGCGGDLETILTTTAPPPVDNEEVEKRFELPAVTAPTFPWEISLNESAVFYQRLLGGGMAVKFVAVALTPQGWAPLPPGVVIVFSDKAWERFQREVAAGGEKAPAIETATQMPRLHLNGETP